MTTSQCQLSKSESQEYSLWRHTYYFMLNRISLFVYLLFHLSFIVYDYYKIDASHLSIGYTFRLLGTLLLAITVILSFFDFYKRYYQLINGICVTFVPVSLMFLMYLVKFSDPIAPIYYYVGIIIQILPIGLLITRWQWAAVSSFLVAGLFIYLFYVIRHPHKDFSYLELSPIIFVLMMSCITTLLSIIYERVHVQMFLAEQQLAKQKTEITEITRVRDKFFSIIAHDLRSPFNSIIGFSELLIHDKIADKEVQEKVPVLINSAAKRTLSLLDNLLYWTRMQTESVHLVKSTLCLANVVHDVVKLCASQSTIKNISVSYSIDESIIIQTDANILTLIVRNLLTNAIKYTHEGGLVTIDASLVDNELIICIADNGVGMNDETCELLFTSNNMTVSLGTNNEKGSGLGLHVCKEFIEKLGGKIWAKSTPSLGSKFYFTLPQ